MPIGAIQLVSDVLPQCEALMQQGRAQFMLCHGHDAVQSGLDPTLYLHATVGSDALVPVSLADATGRPMHSLEQAKVASLDYSAESGLGRLLRSLRVGKVPGASTSTVFTAHLATVLRTMALQGRGLAWLPRSLIEDDLRAGRLVAAGVPGSELTIDVRLVRRRAPEPATAEAFWAAVTRSVGTISA
jgi:DNA-binding transcriptional LysR family regulator